MELVILKIGYVSISINQRIDDDDGFGFSGDVVITYSNLALGSDLCSVLAN